MTSIQGTTQRRVTPFAANQRALLRASTFSHLGEDAVRTFVSFTLTGPGPTLVMGPNGAGKSHLLRLAHGLLSPTPGDRCPRVRRGAAPPKQWCYQNPVLLRRSAEANLTHALAVTIPAQGTQKARP